MKYRFHHVAALTALTIASATAQAEGLSFYALLDASIAHSSISGAGAPSPSSKTEFVTGGYAPNFAGISYEKGIAGGMTGGFKLEQGFLLSSPPTGGSHYAFGNGDLFNRQANVFLKGSKGTLTLGTQPNIAFNAVLLGDPRFASNYGSSLAAIDISGELNTVDNASLSYASPAFSGLTLAAQYVPESRTAAGEVKSGNRMSLNYGGEKLSAALATYSSEINGRTVKNTGTVLAASYKLGLVTLKGIAADQKTATFTSSALKTTGFGGAYAVNPETTLDFGYYKSKSSANNYDMPTIAAGVQYKIMKDLTLYGQYAKVDNKGTASTPYNFTWTTIFTGNISTGQTASTTNVGLLYSFF